MIFAWCYIEPYGRVGKFLPGQADELLAGAEVYYGIVISV